jgi:site-specific recombinase XerD
MNCQKTKHAVQEYMRGFENCVKEIRRFHYLAITRFLSYIHLHCNKAKGYWHISEDIIRKWMKHVSGKIVALNTTVTFRSVNRFLEALVIDGILSANPMQTIYTRYGKCGWKGIASAFHSKTPDVSLKALIVESPFKGNVGKYSKAYLELKQASGAPCLHIKKALLDFNRFLETHSIPYEKAFTCETIYKWTSTTSGHQNCRREKALTLRHFFHYLLTTGVVKQNPVTQIILDNIGPHQRSFKPYIFSPDEINALLRASEKLAPNYKFKLKPQAIYTMISLLYTLGLRIGEMCRLQIGDIDIDRQTILIRNSKFYKDRILPFGPALTWCLTRYIEKRRNVFKPVKPNSPVFVARPPKAISETTIKGIFVELMKNAGVPRESCRRRPRVHDLRHTFAVHRLLRWYKEDVNVQNKLMLLSTFMGHIDIYSTQVYLTITDELLVEANRRFHLKFNDVLKCEA